MKSSFLLVAVLLLACLLPASATAQQEDVLKGLHKGHPRLFFRQDDLPRLRQLIKSDPVLQNWHTRLTADAKRILTEKPVEYIIVGPRLLTQSRRALDRVSTLAGLYLLDGDERFAERAAQELFAAAKFKDWNPSHFLDTAEMATAFAIGYDWLYHYLNPDERRVIREALIRHGVNPGLKAFDPKKPAFFTRVTHNWAQVCNGGLTIGALAIADEERELASKLIELCREPMRRAMTSFAPDGGIDEGPGYWSYATRYNVFYLACTESALGTDFGMKAMPGFANTAFFRIHSIGPVGQTFNYADAGNRAGPASQMIWFANAFNQPLFASHEAKLSKDNPDFFHLAYARSKLATDNWQLATDAFFRHTETAFFRSSFDDPRALYVGIKGGDNRANHSHLDLGSFVLDYAGHRWAADLGPDDYNLPGFFGGQRWTYYRLRTESHNVITLDDENQQTDGKAPVIAYQSTPQRAHAVIDLTHGYRDKAKHYQRGLAVLNRAQVLIQDELEAAGPVSVRWNFLTSANVSIDNRIATLTQGKETLHLRILAPSNATFEILSANPPRPQKQQPEMKNVSIKLPDKVQATRIVVLIGPDTGAATTGIVPLAEWGGRK